MGGAGYSYVLPLTEELCSWLGGGATTGLNATSLGTDPEDQPLRASGQQGGVPLSLETNSKIKGIMQVVEAKRTMSQPLGGLTFLLCERLD